MPTSKIGLHDLDPSLFETLSNISGSNSQTKIFPLQVVASEDNQTIFPIGLGTFDAETDFAFVQSGITNLFYGADFTIENKNIILNEGVPAGRTLGIYVLKNVAQSDEEDYVSGANLAPGSVTPDKIGGVLPIEKGGTGATTAEEVLTNLAGAKASDLTEHTGNKDNPHEVTAEQVGALPLTGGWLSGNLGVGGGTGELTTWDGGVGIDALKGNQRARLQVSVVNDQFAYPTVALDNQDGQPWKVHQIYGEHNVTKGTTDIGAGSALANGFIHLVYE